MDGNEIMEGRRLTLRKGERLRHKNLVNGIFNGGGSIYDFPLRLCWRARTEAELLEAFRTGVPEKVDKVQMLITVPKKKRKRAVDRVLLRRRIREAYRRNRLPLLDCADNCDNLGTVSLAFIYMDGENADYATIEAKMISVLNRLRKKLQNRNSKKPAELTPSSEDKNAPEEK